MSDGLTEAWAEAEAAAVVAFPGESFGVTYTPDPGYMAWAGDDRCAVYAWSCADPELAYEPGPAEALRRLAARIRRQTGEEA